MASRRIVVFFRIQSRTLGPSCDRQQKVLKALEGSRGPTLHLFGRIGPIGPSGYHVVLVVLEGAQGAVEKIVRASG